MAVDFCAQAGQMLATLMAFRSEEEPEEVRREDEELSMLSQESVALDSIPDVDAEESMHTGEGNTTADEHCQETYPLTNAISTTSQSSSSLSPLAPEFIPSSERRSWSTPGTDRAVFLEVFGDRTALSQPSESDASLEPLPPVIEDHSAARMLAMTGATFDWRTEDSRSRDEAQSTTSFDLTQILSSTCNISRLDNPVVGDDPDEEQEGANESDQEVMVAGTEDTELGDGETKMPAESGEEPLIVSVMRSRCTPGLRSGRLGSSAKRRITEGEGTVDGVGFMTDGRGRVIGTSEESLWLGEGEGEGTGSDDD
jgi:hypothetical protein